HGTAPDLAGRHVANPTAAILSVALLLRHHWHRPDLATLIENAVRATIEGGRHTLDIALEDAMTTEAFTDSVCDMLRS
ncbi:MAG TPA: isocitrate/isopropylmalate family dehydrogenase, partial [Aggregatilineales bacterium]|nr:isocitrate/isopropylmalate family dehydrogenase [Aggregatilineales bacterium]